MTIRLNGPTEKFSDTSLSNVFSTFEIGEPTKPKERLIRHMGNKSLLLDANRYFIFPHEGMHATFIEREDFSLGREESRHQVRFGQLVVNGPGVHEAPDFVAIKPFDDRRELYTEWAANSYINAIFDDQQAYLPLGIAKNKHGETSMISLYEHGVVTADSVFWADQEQQPEALRSKVIERAALTSVYSLGLMHGVRLIHGDAQAKNLAWDNRQPRFVDLESSVLVPEDAVDDPEFTSRIARDVITFLQSTMQVEENEDRIAAVLSKPAVVKAMIDSYSAGIKQGSLRHETQIPDYAALHEEQIRDVITRTFK